jgi:hypothetical protein
MPCASGGEGESTLTTSPAECRPLTKSATGGRGARAAISPSCDRQPRIVAAGRCKSPRRTAWPARTAFSPTPRTISESACRAQRARTAAGCGRSRSNVPPARSTASRPPRRTPRASSASLGTTAASGRLMRFRAPRERGRRLRLPPMSETAGSAPLDRSAARDLRHRRRAQPARSRREACRSASPARAASTRIHPRQRARLACRASSVRQTRRRCRKWSPTRAPRAHSLLVDSRSVPFARQGPLQKLWLLKTAAWNAQLGAFALRIRAHRCIARSVRSAISSAVRSGKTARIAQWERSAARRAASPAHSVPKG